MIKQIFLIFILFNLAGCGGFTSVAGLKFKKEVGAEANLGNPNHTTDTLKLKNGKFISFNRPIGECGGGVTFFGIILPIIPVKFSLNNCEDVFTVNTTSKTILSIKLKYNKEVYEHITVEKWEKKHGDKVYMSGKKFKFKIDNFWKFRMADDKAIIVIGEDSEEELPVKWGVMIYNNWVVP